MPPRQWSTHLDLPVSADVIDSSRLACRCGRDRLVVAASLSRLVREPVVNERGCAESVLWPDGWTICTADGGRSAQFEHTLLVTEDGVELLTAQLGCERSTL